MTLPRNISREETRYVPWRVRCQNHDSTILADTLVYKNKEHEAGSSKNTQNREPRASRHMKLVRDQRQLVNLTRASRERCLYHANEYIFDWWNIRFWSKKIFKTIELLKQYWLLWINCKLACCFAPPKARQMTAWPKMHLSYGQPQKKVKCSNWHGGSWRSKLAISRQELRKLTKL